jgi:hypothetical protein
MLQPIFDHPFFLKSQPNQQNCGLSEGGKQKKKPLIATF